MVNVGIIGATGYTGEELISILLRHPQVRITYLSAKIEKPTPISDIFPKFRNRLNVTCRLPETDLAVSTCDVLFLALPHTVSMDWVPRFLKANRRVIDLSADYRLKDKKIYERFYKNRHRDVHNLKQAVYGLPEIYRSKIKQARLVANPGCYPTAAVLGLAPLIACDVLSGQEDIIIDAKTGVTGAGRRALLEYSFSELNEDMYAYKINIHQHMPEIKQELSKLGGKNIKFTFVPHLLSVNRGILETIYVKLNQSSVRNNQKRKGNKEKDLLKLYKNFYKKEPFVRIREGDGGIRLRDVVGTNFCDITIRCFPEKDLLIIITAIDNLIKGAAGQAVQNMNIMYDFYEQTALV